jgi:hypothetical protein
MCEYKKHKHKKADFSFTGKMVPAKKVKVGHTEFVAKQYEEGVEQKNKGATDLSLMKVHKFK